MINSTITGNTGTRCAGILLFGNELQNVFIDIKWVLIFVLAMIIADYRLGCEESSMKHQEATKFGDKLLADKYEFRMSKARRRTINKFIDYTIYIIVGVSMGKALLTPLTIDYTWGAWVVAFLIAVFIEIPSSAGHLFYVRGVTVQKKTVRGFFKAFFVALAKSKSEDVGGALEQGFEKIEENDKK